jgi:hypothetical protein
VKTRFTTVIFYASRIDCALMSFTSPIVRWAWLLEKALPSTEEEGANAEQLNALSVDDAIVSIKESVRDLAGDERARWDAREGMGLDSRPEEDLWLRQT